MNTINYPMGTHSLARRVGGFTLIELMMTVVIVGILTAVALPSYNDYIRRSHRANAQSALVQTAQWLERAATAQGTYPPIPLSPGLLKVEGARYTVTYVVSANQAAYTLTAAPSTPAQTPDGCGGFRIDERGVKTITGTLPITECWNR